MCLRTGLPTIHQAMAMDGGASSDLLVEGTLPGEAEHGTALSVQSFQALVDGGGMRHIPLPAVIGVSPRARTRPCSTDNLIVAAAGPDSRLRPTRSYCRRHCRHADSLNPPGLGPQCCFGVRFGNTARCGHPVWRRFPGADAISRKSILRSVPGITPAACSCGERTSIRMNGFRSREKPFSRPARSWPTLSV